jgi:hypothetical protein
MFAVVKDADDMKRRDRYAREPSSHNRTKDDMNMNTFLLISKSRARGRGHFPQTAAVYRNGTDTVARGKNGSNSRDHLPVREGSSALLLAASADPNYQ